MQENKLLDLSMNFSVSILQLTGKIKGHSSLVNQLERSATSVGANIHESCYAQSKPDFISKLQIALKECHETKYWLELFSRASLCDNDSIQRLRNECDTIRRILVSSINTAKGNK
ncbi:four helix bundle protein [Aristaeella lactis]|uniref:Four helix bundle protein n=1 Tax=Aristaeella lactis TaxID=3046383 RepID=A0AC61PJ93_9FIRM|nr:four helix bundle protein [Aristaeella lactis]QUA53983.1 four helix bundle protein [Aristaeella lactis]SMC41958.1 four helix bundle protein [Aristaeella lactis]